MMLTDEAAPTSQRILVLGATGTIGRAVTRALVACGHDVTCLVRPRSLENTASEFAGADVRACDVANPSSLAGLAHAGQRFDAIVSCLASRTGAPADAWAIDYEAHSRVLAWAKGHSVRHMILLSAICVQKPRLAFQHAKLAFEQELVASGLTYSIVRPTAYFKSLSGQVERLRRGKPFLMFGSGTLTACKPISDDDLAKFIAGCLHDERRWNAILPIGGPGAAITPLQQGERLFELLQMKPRFRHVPVAMLDAIIATLSGLGRLSRPLADKAELARIGRYYATESMLLLDPATGRYDADKTPSAGSETLFDFYARLVRGEARIDLGAHAVF